MATNQLSALALRSVKPRPKPFKLTDGEGLYLLVRPTGAWLWQMAFRFGGKQKTHSIGPYPKVSLSAARMERGEAKALLAENRDPTVVKKLAKTNGVVEVENTVEAVAREWHATKK